LERRLARLKLSMIRVLSAIALGAASAYHGGAACSLGAAVYAVLYTLTALYAQRRMRRVLNRQEALTTGMLPALAGYLLGLYLGSALALNVSAPMD